MSGTSSSATAPARPLHRGPARPEGSGLDDGLWPKEPDEVEAQRQVGTALGGQMLHLRAPGWDVPRHPLIVGVGGLQKGAKKGARGGEGTPRSTAI